MKRILLTMLVAFACLPMLAQSVTFDFLANDYNMERLSGTTSQYNEDGQVLATVDGVTLTNIKGDGNGTRLWSNGLRFYKGGQVKITSSGEAIKGVTFEPGSSDLEVSSEGDVWYVTCKLTSSYVAMSTLKVWFTEPTPTPDAPKGEISVAEVLKLIEGGYRGTAQVKGYITEIASTQADVDQYGDINYYISDDKDGSNSFYIYNGYYLGGAKFTSIDQVKVGDLVVVEGTCTVYQDKMELARGNKIISLNGQTSGGNGGNTGGEIPSEYWTVAQAIQFLEAGNEGEAVVKGFISKVQEIDTGSYGNATYFIVDEMGSSVELEVYRGYGLNGDKFTSASQLKVGAEVVVSGKLVTYNGTKEFTSGSKIVYYDDSNATGPTTPDISDAWTVAQAIAWVEGGNSGNAMVRGFVSKVTEIGGSYGNATYYIVDKMGDSTSLEVYRGYGLDGKKFTSSEELLIGAEVVVSGELVYYNNKTIEFTSGSKLLYYDDSNAEPPVPADPAITGTKDAPLSVAQFLQQGAPAQAIQGTYVCGYIVGWINGMNLSDAVFGTPDADENQTNILIAASSSETSVEYCIPVALPAGNVRTDLNLYANPSNLGKLVTLMGSHEKYFGANGLKNVTKYWWGRSGVEMVGADEAEAFYYNLQGQKVANPDKGIYIKVVGNKAVKVAF